MTNKKAYVTADGNYGSDEILIFNVSDLTRRQWETLSEESDYAKIEYVKNILKIKERRKAKNDANPS